MDIKIIIAGVLGIAAGGAAGYFVCRSMDKRKVEKAYSDGYQQALDEIRGGQRKKIIDNENKKSEMVKIDSSTIVKVNQINEANGYVNDNDDVEPEGAPDDDDDGLPFETPIMEAHSIWDDAEEKEDDGSVTQEEYDAEQEPEVPIDISKLDPKKKPYPITAEQYNSDFTDEVSEGFWDKVSLILFTDNIFAERRAYNEYETMSSSEIILAIGKDNMKKLIEDRSIGRAFVRNNKLHIDYEIVRSPRSYSSVLHEDDEEE